MARQAKYEELRMTLLAEMAGSPPHTPLPTEREISARHGVSRNTVRQALDALEAAGAVYRVQGAGTFVAPAVVSKSLALTSFSEDMRDRDLEPASRLLAAGTVRAGRQVAGLLEIDPEAEVVRVSRLRLADGAPMCLETVHLPAERVPGLTQEDLSGSLYELLSVRHGLEIGSAEQIVRAVDLAETESALLGVPVGSSGLRVQRVGLDRRESPVEATTTLYRADRYDIRFTVRRAARS
ncbi:GntR family transcriptional regulator [Streptomyces tubbatahanensis]|uniref:GntR family transcriptional regulator n=1 Tax=Streptomyces tubbatahanensis TaxID=2923272 RepID=A0ABY3Y1U3_9ACTN|nr:GntR family transcriptional regulator [Streptomyces tubbatahanensis]UNT00555.1 GntR family transcriptional regulator [Streptomyces tubbatahanensis]